MHGMFLLAKETSKNMLIFVVSIAIADGLTPCGAMVFAGIQLAKLCPVLWDLHSKSYARIDITGYF